MLVNTIPQLPSHNPLEASKFYVEKLGFNVVFESREFVVLNRDSAVIHLWGPCGSQILPDNSSCYINVKNIDAFYKQLKDVNVAKPLQTEPWGKREFYIKDTDGNLLKFGESIEENTV